MYHYREKCAICDLRSLHPQYHDWGALDQGTEPPTAPRATQHKWLPTAPGVSSRCVCVHCCVCALWMGKYRAQIPSMGHHTWSYVTSLTHSQQMLMNPIHEPFLRFCSLYTWSLTTGRQASPCHTPSLQSLMDHSLALAISAMQTHTC